MHNPCPQLPWQQFLAAQEHPCCPHSRPRSGWLSRSPWPGVRREEEEEGLTGEPWHGLVGQ